MTHGWLVTIRYRSGPPYRAIYTFDGRVPCALAMREDVLRQIAPRLVGAVSWEISDRPDYGLPGSGCASRTPQQVVNRLARGEEG